MCDYVPRRDQDEVDRCAERVEGHSVPPLERAEGVAIQRVVPGPGSGSGLMAEGLGCGLGAVGVGIGGWRPVVGLGLGLVLPSGAAAHMSSTCGIIFSLSLMPRRLNVTSGREAMSPGTSHVTISQCSLGDERRTLPSVGSSVRVHSAHLFSWTISWIVPPASSTRTSRVLPTPLLPSRISTPG